MEEKFSVFPPPLMEKSEQETRSAPPAHWKNYTRKTKAKQWEHENLLHNWFLPSSSHVIRFQEGRRRSGRLGLEGRLCSVYSLEHRIDLLIHLFSFFVSYITFCRLCLIVLPFPPALSQRLWSDVMHSVVYCRLCLGFGY